MKVTYKYNHWFLRFFFQWARAMTLGHTILFKYPKEQVSQSTVRHELAHVEQIEKHGVLKFYFKYFLYLLRYGYKKNPFEVEARKKADGQGD